MAWSNNDSTIHLPTKKQYNGIINTHKSGTSTLQMIDFSPQTMRKLVAFSSALFLNKRCPMWLQRKGLNLLGGYARLPKGIKQTKNTLAEVPVWWFNPERGQTRQVVLYFHGGGYGVGSPRSHRDLCAHLAYFADLSVASLAYRLAPEHPYPAALDDALAAYQALLDQGHQSQQIALAGDSAGGGLALSLSLLIKQLKLPQAGCLFLISPWVNKSRDNASHSTQFAVDPVINEGWSKQMARHYLKDSEALRQQACLADRDLRDLPPMLIHVGTDEVLLDDSLQLKQRAIQAIVPVTLITYPELWHVFHFSASLFKPARQALQQAGHYLAKKLT